MKTVHRPRTLLALVSAAGLCGVGCGAAHESNASGSAQALSVDNCGIDPSAVFTARLSAEAATLGTASGGIVNVEGLSIQPIVGGNYVQGDPTLPYAWLVANGNRAFVVGDGFLRTYAGHLPTGDGLVGKLGAPLEDGYAWGNGAIQLFQYGYLTWNSTTGAIAVHYVNFDDDPQPDAAGPAIFASRLSAESDLGQAAGPPATVSGLYVEPISGGSNYTPGDPSLPFVWLVANGALNQAFVVADGFYRMYNPSLLETLGAPIEDAHAESIYPSVQLFQRGYLLWNQSTWSGEVHTYNPEGLCTYMPGQ